MNDDKELSLKYDTELEISKISKKFDNLLDDVQELFDLLSACVTNGEHALNVERLQKFRCRFTEVSVKCNGVYKEIDKITLEALENEINFLKED